ncbi:hypothetical protein HNY73_017423 [Argiope bruennichi]|uniref:Uncharacterized protein n=1 Tax=Argiope bruennichi TaxID=94029 RepID=A0A8T0EDM0_ARGBR|nr:hypothetical protein HNY73_017423 [Argiope bruennichi]
MAAGGERVFIDGKMDRMVCLDILKNNLQKRADAFHQDEVYPKAPESSQVIFVAPLQAAATYSATISEPKCHRKILGEREGSVVKDVAVVKTVLVEFGLFEALRLAVGELPVSGRFSCASKEIVACLSGDGRESIEPLFYFFKQRSSSEEEVSSAVDLLEEMSYRLYRKLTDPKDELGDEVDGVSETDSKDREVFIDASRDFALHLYLNHEEVEEYDVWRIIPRPPHTLDFSPAVVASALAQRKKMMYSHGLFAFVFVFVCWRAVKTQESPDEVQRGSNENHLAAERMMRYTPDMRLVLNGLLRYENAISKKPEESLPYPFFHLTNRSIKGSLPPVDDPLAVLATGFMGSRGKRDDYDEIPVFANGFPAGRG